MVKKKTFIYDDGVKEFKELRTKSKKRKKVPEEEGESDEKGGSGGKY